MKKLTLAKETIASLNWVKGGAVASENPQCDTCTAITQCMTDLTCQTCICR